MTVNLFVLSSSTIEFLFICIKQQLAKNAQLFNYKYLFSSQTSLLFRQTPYFLGDSDQLVTALSISCYFHISELCCIHSCLHFKTTIIVATSIALSLTTVIICTTVLDHGYM